MSASKYDRYEDELGQLTAARDEWSWGDHGLNLVPDINSRVRDRITGLVYQGVNAGFWLGRRVFGPFRLFGFLVLSRDGDIRAALLDRQRFKVPFGGEMNILAGPPVFGLGDDGDEHLRQREIMHRVARADDGDCVMQNVREISEALLEDARGEIDAVEDLLIPALGQSCLMWFGLAQQDPSDFVWANIAISELIFGSPSGASDGQRRRALEGARRVKGALLHRLSRPDTVPEDSVLGRLLFERNHGAPLADGTSCTEFLTDDRIVSICVGMLSGSAPTTLIAAAQAADRLLRNRRYLKVAGEAARADAPDMMLQIVRECFRLRPATWPGVFRKVDLSKTSTTSFAGIDLRDGESVLVAVPSALRDRKVWGAPSRFDPDRMTPADGAVRPDPDPQLAFGLGDHDCLGRWFAETVTTGIFMALFARPGLSRRGMLRSRSVFPGALPVRYDHARPLVAQDMVFAAVPLRFDAREEDLAKERLAQTREAYRARRGKAPGRRAGRVLAREARHRARAQAGQEALERAKAVLAGLNANPVGEELFRRLTATGQVHTCSVSVAPLMSKGQAAPYLLMEFNVDAPRDKALRAVHDALGPALRELIATCGYGDVRLDDLVDQFDATPRLALRAHKGVSFNGVPEWTADQIEAESRLARRVEKELDELTTVGGLTVASRLSALDKLNAVRAKIFQDDALRPMLYRARSRSPAFAAYRPMTFNQAIGRWFRTPQTLSLALVVPVLALVVGILAVRALGVTGIVTTALLAVALTVSALAILGGIGWLVWGRIWGRLRGQEARDAVDDRYVPLDQHNDAREAEDAPGLVQNNFLAINSLKPGWMRGAVLLFGFWLIVRQVLHWFRPGFVLELDTIRHARWVRVRGTQSLIFQATFDGSWERYLEDFSDRVAQGQTLIWSNCEGFPRTQGLWEGGARDGERFKRWVRGRQVRSGLWYSRFGHMTNDRIRRNALIRDGLARAATSSQASAWLRLFGSSPRQRPDVLETQEMASIVLAPFKQRPVSYCFGLSITDAASFRLRLQEMLDGRTSDWTIHGRRLALAYGPTAADTIDLPCWIGFSARGLHRLGMPVDGRSTHLRQLQDFPLAFSMGMGARSRITGDDMVDDVVWTDNPQDETAVDAVLYIYGDDISLTEPDLDRIKERLSGAAEVVQQLATRASDPGPTKEGKPQPPWLPGQLRFRDGIAQPAMKGLPTTAMNDPEAVADGEIVLGYRDERDLVGPSPAVPASWDLYGDLPDVEDRKNDDWPDFSRPQATTRDFGRNGTYAVLRQLEVDADAVEDSSDGLIHQAEAKFGTEIPGAWPARKIVGRQRDGAPNSTLLPFSGTLEDQADPSQDTAATGRFLYNPEQTDPAQPIFDGVDPHGHLTPLGSHIRRANPRDSLDGGAEFAPGRKRHRILRRGRAYKDGNTNGLLFMCLNASIERQFEFVQQTWVNSRVFHGLWDEDDPLLSPEQTRQFSVPTPEGRLKLKLSRRFVTYRGGGYFFVPGRSALRSLTRRRPD